MEKTKIIPFWKWFWVTLLSVVPGMGVTVFLSTINHSHSLSSKANAIVGFGLIVSVLQHFLMRKRHDIGKQWIWSSTVSILITFWILDQLRYFFSWMEPDSESNFDGIKMYIGFLGMVLGQALLLRKLGYKSWYLFVLSGLAPLITFLLFAWSTHGVHKTIIIEDDMLAMVLIPLILVSYPVCNALAFKYIQEKNNIN